MTKREFLKLLRDSRKKIRWFQRSDGSIRGRSKSCKKLFCPITGVGYFLNKDRFYIIEYFKCGKKLGLINNTIHKIVYVSDNDFDYIYNGNAVLRKELLTAVGLK